MDIDVKLVCFVPVSQYFYQRRTMRSYGWDNMVVIPVVNRWQGTIWMSYFNALLVHLIGGRTIMSRSPASGRLCLRLKNKGWNFIYDARGAFYKELEEFTTLKQSFIKDMMDLEVICFKEAHWVYSVSNALIEHFKFEHRYREHNHSVVPCCYVEMDETPAHTVSPFQDLKESDVVFCYAGSLNTWNFPNSFLKLCKSILRNPANKLIILSKELNVLKKHKIFSQSNCYLGTVPHNEVKNYLEMSDYAILLRKKAVTNKVASPTKFADYIGAGCKVIISPEIGDCSSFVEDNNMGLVYTGGTKSDVVDSLESLSNSERARIKELASKYYHRESELNLLKYRNLQRIHAGEFNDLRAEEQAKNRKDSKEVVK
jgi:hypothetical protein